MGTMSVSGRFASFERRLDPLPASVREARGLTRDLLQDADREDLVDNALLLVTEVVTNALLHAGTSIDLSAVLGEDGLRVVVADGSPHLPVRRRYGPSAGTGRGLMILDQLVDDWGVEQRDFGKAVWFRLFHGARAGAGREVELRQPAGVDVDHDPTAAVTPRNFGLTEIIAGIVATIRLAHGLADVVGGGGRNQGQIPDLCPRQVHNTKRRRLGAIIIEKFQEHPWAQ